MSDAPPPRRRSWVPIVLAVLGGLVLVGAAAVGGSVYWVTRHIHSQETTTREAERALADARTRFAGQTPVVSLEGQQPVFAREPAPGGPVPIRTLHMLAFDAGEGRLIRLDIPGWLLRLVPRGNVTVNGRDLFDAGGPGARGGRGTNITVEDLERRGPGLVLDTTTPDGSQVLIWTE
jgi:hypothetical protein